MRRRATVSSPCRRARVRTRRRTQRRQQRRRRRRRSIWVGSSRASPSRKTPSACAAGSIRPALLCAGKQWESKQRCTVSLSTCSKLVEATTTPFDAVDNNTISRTDNAPALTGAAGGGRAARGVSCEITSNDVKILLQNKCGGRRASKNRVSDEGKGSGKNDNLAIRGQTHDFCAPKLERYSGSCSGLLGVAIGDISNRLRGGSGWCAIAAARVQTTEDVCSKDRKRRAKFEFWTKAPGILGAGRTHDQSSKQSLHGLCFTNSINTIIRRYSIEMQQDLDVITSLTADGVTCYRLVI